MAGLRLLNRLHAILIVCLCCSPAAGADAADVDMARMNDAIEAWIAHIDSDRPFLLLDIGAGDQVIVPSLTFISTATAVSRLGAEVVFADVDPASLTLDPESVADAASRCPNLRAVVLVHLFGHSPESDALRAVAERHGAAIMYNMGLDSPDFDSMAAAAKRLFDMGVRVVGLGAMEWHMQMALEHIRKNSIG